MFVKTYYTIWIHCTDHVISYKGPWHKVTYVRWREYIFITKIFLFLHNLTWPHFSQRVVHLHKWCPQCTKSECADTVKLTKMKQLVGKVENPNQFNDIKRWGKVGGCQSEKEWHARKTWDSSSLSSAMGRLCLLFECDMSSRNMKMKYGKLVPCAFSAFEQQRLFASDGNQYMKRNQSVNMFLFFSTSKELSLFWKTRRNMDCLLQLSSPRRLSLWKSHFLEVQSELLSLFDLGVVVKARLDWWDALPLWFGNCIAAHCGERVRQGNLQGLTWLGRT